MRILGLDLGSKTLGMAISDETATIATPLGTARIPEYDLEAALEAALDVIDKYRVEKNCLGIAAAYERRYGYSGRVLPEI